MEERFALLERAVVAVSARGPEAVEERIVALQDELRETRRRLRAGAAAGGRPKPGDLAAKAEEIAPGVAFVGAALDLESIEALKGFAKDMRGALPSGVIALGLDADEPQLFVTVSDDLVARGIAAGPLVSVAVTSINGRGGGRPEMAQGRGTRREGLGDAIAAVRAAASDRAASA
jgi:alanyl-tRNA synthetase